MTEQPSLFVFKPIITYPREAQVGKTYLMTIDLQPEEGFEWQYEEEEYPIYCSIDSGLFSSKSVGEPVIVLHRFGGSYGSIRFLLTALSEAREGKIGVTLFSRWGVLINQFELSQIKIKNLFLNSEQEIDAEVTKANEITGIINSRRVLVSKLERTHNNLSSLLSKLQELKEFQAQLIQELSDQSHSERLRKFSFDESQASISDKIIHQRKIIERFSRDTINIGVIGQARQGKSRLIQSITGLSSVEIPDGNMQICTAVPTTVQHDSHSEASAKVWLHSESSFLNEIIKPHYERLQLGASPATLEDFAKHPLPALPSISGSTSQSILYEELSKYHRDFDKYKDLLTIASPQIISHQQIRNFATQDGTNDDYISFSHLAVKEVEITSYFSNSNATQLALIDMPGLGDIHILKERNVLEKLQDDVDIVLFVRRPDPHGDAWLPQDIRLYDMAAAVAPSPLSMCSFMILNRTKGNVDNVSICKYFKNDITRKYINVVDCIIADCADREEVNQKILNVLIDFLSQNISNIDEQYLMPYQNELNELQKYIASTLNEAKSVLDNPNSSFSTTTKVFDRFWQTIASSLFEFLDEQKHDEYINKYVNMFRSSINEVINDSRKNPVVPSLETLEQVIVSKESYKVAFFSALVQIRAELSRKFLELDGTLKKISEDMRSDVSDILIEQVKLSHLNEKRGSEFLQQLTDLIPQDAGNLRLGIQNLSSFNVSYSNLLQTRIRECFKRFDPDNNANALDNNIGTQKDAREIRDALEAIYSEVLDCCEKTLVNTLQEPNQLFCAAVEEFIDRVVLTNGVEDEWLLFLAENRDKNSENLEQSSELLDLLQTWQHLIANVEAVNADVS